MSTLFESGDRVVVFDSLNPDGPPEECIVGRVTKFTLRLKGDASAHWAPNGRHQRSRTLRLLRPEDLPAAQEEARRAQVEREALNSARHDAHALAHAISGVTHGCETAAQVRAKVAEVLCTTLADYMGADTPMFVRHGGNMFRLKLDPVCTECRGTGEEPAGFPSCGECGGSGRR